MKIDKLFLVILIMLAIITVGAVSAAENVTSEDVDIYSTADSEVLDEARTTEMDVDTPKNLEYNTQATFRVNMSEGSYGEVELYVNGNKETYYNKDWSQDGPFDLYLTPQVFGDCKVEIKFAGNKDFTPVAKTYSYYINNLTISMPDKVFLNEYNTLLVEFPEDAKGNYEISIANITQKGSVEQYVSVSYRGLDVGTADVNVKFTTSNKKYNSRTYSKKITIYPGTMYYPSNWFVYNGTNCIIFLASDNDATFKISVDGKAYTEFKSEKEYRLYLPELSMGNHNLIWEYVSDDLNYTGWEPLCVHPNIPAIDYIHVGNASLEIPFPADNTGNITVWLNDEVKYNGTAAGLIKIPFVMGSEDVVLRTFYIDNNTFSEGVENEYTMHPTENSPDWNMQITMASEIFKYVNENPQVSINTPDNYWGKLEFFVDGKKIDIGEFDFRSLKLGKHTLEARSTEDSYFNDVNATHEFEVKNVVVTFPEEIFYTASDFIECYFPSDVKGKVKFYIDGKLKETKNAEDYTWFSNDDELSFGYHTYRVVYEGGNYEKFDLSKKIKFSYKIYPLNKAFIFGEDFIYGNTNTMRFHVPDGVPGTFTVTLDGVEYTLKCEYICELDISHLKAGNYTMKIEYPGSGKFYKLSFTHDIEIEPQILQIKASNANVYYDTGALYKVRILDMTRTQMYKQEVNIVFPTYTKTLKTDVNGYASFKITNKPGTYQITVGSDRMIIYKKITVKHVVALKEVKVKRSAKKLVLTATLKNPKVMKNKPVTFKFNGKTYNAKTNSKGIAKVTVKSAVLKKLKAGKKITYSATYLKDTVKKTVKVLK